MNFFIIDYDLNSPGKNYDALIAAIQKYRYKKICKSSWAIASLSNAAQIRDILLPYLDTNDRLFVAKVESDWAAWGVPQEVADWLNQ